jgi:branched-chain amino acid transport system permease protein
VILFWSGISVGAIYALLALTYGLTLTSSNTFNFAQAQLVMVGAFSAYVCGTSLRLPTVLVICVGGAVGGAVGFLEEFCLIRVLGPNAHEAALVTTVGAALALDGIALAIWGSQPRPVTFPGTASTISLLGGRFQLADIVLIVGVLVVAAALHLFTRRTRWGLAIQATAADPQAAQLRGINTRLVSSASFVAVGVLLGISGLAIGSQTFAVYNMSDNLIVYAFVALALGGFRSYGAIAAGGFGVGIVLQVSARYYNANLGNVILFVILITLLMLRPAGFLRTGQRREV